jgi:hypothetical protein
MRIPWCLSSRQKIWHFESWHGHVVIRDRHAGCVLVRSLRRPTQIVLKAAVRHLLWAEVARARNGSVILFLAEYLYEEVSSGNFDTQVVAISLRGRNIRRVHVCQSRRDGWLLSKWTCSRDLLARPGRSCVSLFQIESVERFVCMFQVLYPQQPCFCSLHFSLHGADEFLLVSQPAQQNVPPQNFFLVQAFVDIRRHVVRSRHFAYDSCSFEDPVLCQDGDGKGFLVAMETGRKRYTYGNLSREGQWRAHEELTVWCKRRRAYTVHAIHGYGIAVDNNLFCTQDEARMCTVSQHRLGWLQVCAL